MSEKEDEIEAEAHGQVNFNASASISYVSGFPKKQLEFAKIARGRAGEIEAKYDDSPKKLPQRRKREHQESVISAVVNSIAFLEGQKDWFEKRLREEKWDIDDAKLSENWDDCMEDALADTSENITEGNSQIEGSKPYEEIKALRKFRNSLLHFDSEKVEAGKEHQEFSAHRVLEKQNFPENNLGTNNTYPFNWLTFEMAERSVRMSFNLWRLFARELGKEEEFLKGVPSP